MPIMAGTNWNDDNIGYESAIDLEMISNPPSVSSTALKHANRDGIKNVNDNTNENNQIFLVIDFRIDFKEIKRKTTKNGYAAI